MVSMQEYAAAKAEHEQRMGELEFWYERLFWGAQAFCTLAVASPLIGGRAFGLAALATGLLATGAWRYSARLKFRELDRWLDFIRKELGGG